MSSQGTRTAIVTGASRGIGAAIAQRLARDGFAVVLNYACNAAEAEAVAASIWKGGGTVLPVAADVADPDAVRRLFDIAEAEYGGTDVLVNNAGVMALAPIVESDDAMFERQVAENLRGTFNGLREGARRLRRGGRREPFDQRRRHAARDLWRPCGDQGGAGGADRHPGKGAARTGRHRECRGARAGRDGAVPGRQAARSRGAPRRDEPARAPRTPEDMAAAVAFLAGPDGGWINGQVLRANGGLV
jgi:3-oxoacyl-[acyl-carrier protein] reductase